MSSWNAEKVQQAILREPVDGWLLCDFRGSDPISARLLNVSSTGILSRRWFYFLPKSGEAKKIVHKIESHVLDALSGERLLYAGWRELEAQLKLALKGAKSIAMNYSPKNAIPYVSRADAGTVELIRSLGVEVKSAADLIQEFEAVLTPDQVESHLRAAKGLRSIVDETFGFVAKRVNGKTPLSEYEVQQQILGLFDRLGLMTYSPPIVAVGSNSGDPHYTPSKNRTSSIQPNDFLLIDLWAKERNPESIYADITWTGFVGKKVPAKHEEIFQIVREARDSALAFVEKGIKGGRTVRGADVDDVARGVISKAGYGDQFIHRTGHNIGQEVHGNGANMDNFETREERKILPKTVFSIEPGIYLKDFGVRSEIDVFVGEGTVEVFGQPIQTTVVPIL